ncbi:MAG: Flp pilus assembly complex ATPase component TadA [Kiritimatiellae bacterium]|nr:Flp pilus assembly complex ATPase component TadA [Kiritimatiellia bacterium]
MTTNDEYALQVLQETGAITAEQVAEALAAKRKDGQSALDWMVEQNYISEEDVLATLAEQFGMPFASVDGDEVDAGLAKLLDAETARKYKAVPLQDDGDSVMIAICDPANYDAQDAIRYRLHDKNADFVVLTTGDIKRLLDKLYPLTFDPNATDTGENLVSQRKEMEVEASEDGDAPVIRLVSLILMDACKLKASDIHLEPMEKHFRVRYRIDGALREMDEPPKRLQSAIISRVKLMANMDLSERRIPQDGRIQIKMGERELDLRVSTVPTNFGESIVMRILDKQNLSLGLPQLGFLSDDQAKFERLIGLPDGVILVTGPTGSGKTTTLYACLGQINRPDKKLITVEDPVEYQMSGINQVQVNRAVGLDFSAALRSILRQAPNIVMIGEIRDHETAEIAMEAALTGHLVFSTLHTNDAPSAVTRLTDIGIKPFLVASALRAAMAQRLVRAICEKCREEHIPTDRERKMLGNMAKNIDSMKMFKGVGCPVCKNTGYKGRKGLFEIFTVDDTVQRMIFDKVPTTQLRARVREMGMRTLREDGMLKVASGMTTLEEVLRATMGDED